MFVLGWLVVLLAFAVIMFWDVARSLGVVPSPHTPAPRSGRSHASTAGVRGESRREKCEAEKAERIVGA